MTLPPALLRSLLARTGVIWLSVRVAVGGIGLVARHDLGPASLTPASVLIPVAVTLLVWVDIRAFRERLLFANLGLSATRISGVVLVFALALEMVAGATLRSLSG